MLRCIVWLLCYTLRYNVVSYGCRWLQVCAALCELATEAESAEIVLLAEAPLVVALLDRGSKGGRAEAAEGVLAISACGQSGKFKRRLAEAGAARWGGAVFGISEFRNFRIFSGFKGFFLFGGAFRVFLSFCKRLLVSGF